MRNRVLIFGAIGLIAGVVLDEYWPVIVAAVARYDKLRKESGQDSLVENLASFLQATVGPRGKDGVPQSPKELYAAIGETILDDLMRYAKLKSLALYDRRPGLESNVRGKIEPASDFRKS